MPREMTTARKLTAATIGVGLGTLVGLGVIIVDPAAESENVAATTTAPPLTPTPTPTPSEEPEASREGEPDEKTSEPTPTRTRTTSKPPTPKDTPKPTRTAQRTRPTPKPKPTPVERAAGVGTTAENEVVRLANVQRARAGCDPLRHDPKLRAAALAHSKDMAARGYFDHESPGGEDPGDRIRDAGFAPIGTWGENIAAGQRTAAEVMAGWMDSPGHKANILSCDFTHIGVGFAGGHWTQTFAGR